MVKFYTRSQRFKIQNDPITMREWIHERDFYTRIQILTKYLTNRRYIFVIEADTLAIQASNREEFKVVVSTAPSSCLVSLNEIVVLLELNAFQMTYNAEGEMLLPIVIHKLGEMTQAVIDYFHGKVQFVASQEGTLDRNSVCIVIYVISL